MRHFQSVGVFCPAVSTADVSTSPVASIIHFVRIEFSSHEPC
jgi:hypothetical protein